MPRAVFIKKEEGKLTFLLLFVLNCYLEIILRISVRTTKATATHFVIFASFASSDLALFLDKKVSAPPAIAPERPELFPDCIITITTSAIQIMS